MKQAILTTFILASISLSCLSQITSNSNISSNSNSFMFTAPFDSLHINLKPIDITPHQHPLISSNNNKHLKIQTSKIGKKRNLENDFAFNESQNPLYNMPCVKPNFESNMPISKPDSTITHTLLIKKIR
jgi:hypothetical protein